MEDKYLTSRDPATGEEIGRTRLHTVEDLREAVARARAVQPAWAATPVRERARAMRRVREHILKHADEIASTISRDNGKTRVDAMTTEVVGAAMCLSYYARMARRFLCEQRIGMGNIALFFKRSVLRRVPVGVVGIITPWNYPFGIPMHEIAKALLAGNAVVFKAASETERVGQTIEECLRAAGLPDGLFSRVVIPGRIAGDAILEAGVDKLFFTGSVEVGKRLMAKAAETLTPVSLELGGNDPMLVCPDADLERAADGAVWGGLSSTGQSCGGVERVYVHEQVYDRFLDLLASRVRALRVGPATSLDVDMGCMTTRRQMETVRSQVDDALEKGARIHAESEVPEAPGGNFLPAMVLVEVDHGMRVMREETFGPVLAVMRVRNMDEAVELANDSDLGLSASVWSRSRRRAGRIARRVSAGAVMVNDHLMNHGLAETPWGGFRNSGIGRTHGRIGFEEMTEPQCIVQDILPLARGQMWWQPYDETVYGGIRGLVQVLYASSLGKRLSGLIDALRLVPRFWVR